MESRVIIRSADRTSGTTTNFAVRLQQFVSKDTPEFYVKVRSLNIPCIPAGRLPGQNWSLAGSFVDVVLGANFKETCDTKTTSDRSLVFVPIVPNQPATLNSTGNDWVLIGNPDNFSDLQVKLFDNKRNVLQTGFFATQVLTGITITFTNGASSATYTPSASAPQVQAGDVIVDPYRNAFLVTSSSFNGTFNVVTANFAETYASPTNTSACLIYRNIQSTYAVDDWEMELAIKPVQAGQRLV